MNSTENNYVAHFPWLELYNPYPPSNNGATGHPTVVALPSYHYLKYINVVNRDCVSSFLFAFTSYSRPLALAAASWIP